MSGGDSVDPVQERPGDPAEVTVDVPALRLTGRRPACARVGRQHQLEPRRAARHPAAAGDRHLAALQRLPWVCSRIRIRLSC